MKESENKNINLSKSRVEEYELSLLKLYGAIVKGKTLRHILGYKSGDAFRKAVERNSIPVPTFVPEGGRARIARTHDIAKWLASLDENHSQILTIKKDIQDG